MQAPPRLSNVYILQFAEFSYITQHINFQFTKLRSPQSFYNSMPLNLSINYIKVKGV